MADTKRMAIADEMLDAVNGGYLMFDEDDYGKGEIWIYHVINGENVNTQYRWSFTDGAAVKKIINNRGDKKDSEVIAELGNLITPMF